MSSEKPNRLFSALKFATEPSAKSGLRSSCPEELIQEVRKNIVGQDEAFQGPFGLRRVLYLDWIASGRAVSFLEDYIKSEVLTVYANTHTTTSATGIQSTLFRNEARQIIHSHCKCSINDVVLFAGTGASGAVHKLVKILGLSLRAKEKRAIVFVGPYEHHSNLLPWRETCDVEIIPEDKSTGGVSLPVLERRLKEITTKANERLIIGSFSAASNISGVLEDVEAMTMLLKKYGALAFFDYATAGPYIPIEMNPKNSDNWSKDAVFLSPHKFLGGVGSPGVLIVKKRLLSNAIPSEPSGGTVFFVTNSSTTYLGNFHEREEGGTQDIVGSVRAALAFQLKDGIGAFQISEIEHTYTQVAIKRLQKIPQLHILGDLKFPRLGVISFLIAAPKIREAARFLHYNFVCALLNDLFGIQSRGGCACAGPYGLELLGITEVAAEFEEELSNKVELVRPGFTRLNLHYTLSTGELEFVLSALEFVCEHGWKFLPLYSYFIDTGEWRHRSILKKFPDRRSLGFIKYRSNRMECASKRHKPIPFSPSLFEKYRDCALEVLKVQQKMNFSLQDERPFFSPKTQKLRWFLLPSEATEMFLNRLPTAPPSAPITHPIITAQKSYKLSNDEDPLGICRKTLPSISVLPSWVWFSGGMALGSLAVASLSTKTPWQRIALTGVLTIFAVISNSRLSTPSLTKNSLYKGKTEKFVLLPKQRSKRLMHSESNDECTTCPPRVKRLKLSPVCGTCFHKHSFNLAECPSCPCVHWTSLDERNTAMAVSCKAAKLEARLRRNIGKAIMENDMIKDGDRVMVGLSGGKDSLTMLSILLQLQKKAPTKFEIGACTIDPCHQDYDPSPLIPYLKGLGVPYFYKKQDIVGLAEKKMSHKTPSFCSFCSRLKRGALYTVCREQNYNVLAMGQHLDDFSESMMMSMFFNGVIRTMKSNYSINMKDDESLRVIRPLFRVREVDCRTYAALFNLPVVSENCPACFEAPQERQRMKQLLAGQEHLNPSLFNSLLKALEPLIALEKTSGVQDLRSKTTEILRKNNCFGDET